MPPRNARGWGRIPSVGISLLILGLFGLTSAAAARAEVSLDRLLAAAPDERARLIAEVADEGSTGLKRLRGEAEGRAGVGEEPARIAEILLALRARLAGVSPETIRKLDGIGDYRSAQPWDENEFLCALLEGPSGTEDGLRAEVLRAFYRRYVKLVELPAEPREEWDSLTKPREVMRRLLRHPLGPETVAALDEHLPVLLYHYRLLREAGTGKLTVEYINSPSLTRESYELLLDLFIEGMQGRRPYGECWAPHDSDATPERTATSAWPALGVEYLRALWRSPHAREADRERLWKAGVEAMLDAPTGNDMRGMLVRQWQALLDENPVPEEWIRALLARASAARDEWDSRRIWAVCALLDPYLQQIPWQRERGGPEAPRWKDVLKWWDGGGSAISPARPLDAPLNAFACILLAPNADADRRELLWVKTEVAPGQVSRVQRRTDHGILSFRVEARQLTWDEGALFVSWDCELWTPNEYDAALGDPPDHARRGKQLRNGLFLDFRRGIGKLNGVRDHDGVVVMLIDKPEALSIPREPDLDWIFGEFYKRCQPGERICRIDLAADGMPRILPKKYQVMMIDRYFDGLGARNIDGTSPLGAACELIPFATRGGGEMGLRYLREWVEQRWEGWEKAEPLLRECETLAQASKAAQVEVSELSESLCDPLLRAVALCELVRPGRLEQMSENQRRQTARAIALKILPTETDPAESARLDQVLRILSGEDFGYSPFAPPEERQRAVQAWMAWAE